MTIRSEQGVHDAEFSVTRAGTTLSFTVRYHFTDVRHTGLLIARQITRVEVLGDIPSFVKDDLIDAFQSRDFERAARCIHSFERCLEAVA